MQNFNSQMGTNGKRHKLKFNQDLDIVILMDNSNKNIINIDFMKNQKLSFYDFKIIRISFSNFCFI